MLCPLSYVPKDGGTRTRDRWIKKEPPSAQQADLSTEASRST
jgi:hypothetical protein